ncbi:nitroreductase family protein [Clostridium carnis]
MSSIFNKNVTEVIKLRHSVRNYENKPLAKDIVEKIEKYIGNIDNPFNAKVRVKLIKKDDYSKETKLGTYGVIKGANYYLAVACENGDFDLETLGYVFQKAILYCTSLGLGTVWLGGTFNKGEFAKAMNISSNEKLPIVSPVGYEGGKKSFLATIMGSNTNKRKAYSEIFFYNDFNTSLSKELSEEYYEALEMIRIAPSAVNKQPWRVLRKGNDLHFYTDGSKEVNKIDIGIAMCNFHLTVKEQDIKGKFEFKNPKIDTKYNYVISWIG